MIVKSVSWATEALDMLDCFDRYSRSIFISKFLQKALNENIFQDSHRITEEGSDFFVIQLPELIMRLYFVWEFDELKNQITVLAVSYEKPKTLKEIKLLSHKAHLGYLKLRPFWQRCSECDRFYL